MIEPAWQYYQLIGGVLYFAYYGDPKEEDWLHDIAPRRPEPQRKPGYPLLRADAGRGGVYPREGVQGKCSGVGAERRDEDETDGFTGI